MTSPAPKPFHEPEENEAQIAALLDGHIDALDHAIERALHYGLEAKVREVVAKHLPPPAASLCEPAKVSPADLPDGLQWAKLTALLRGFSKRRLSADEHKTLEEMRLFVQAQMRRHREPERQEE